MIRSIIFLSILALKYVLPSPLSTDSDSRLVDDEQKKAFDDILLQISKLHVCDHLLVELYGSS